MNKIRVIDLLNKIANGEEVPKKIKYKDEVREYVHQYRDYVNSNSNRYFLFFSIMKNGKGSDFADALNDEVEIIEDAPKEDKKINRVSLLDVKTDYRLKDILNEIIDKVNGE